MEDNLQDKIKDLKLKLLDEIEDSLNNSLSPSDLNHLSTVLLKVEDSLGLNSKSLVEVDEIEEEINQINIQYNINNIQLPSPQHKIEE